jgi:hypothetical protein
MSRKTRGCVRESAFSSMPRAASSFGSSSTARGPWGTNVSRVCGRNAKFVCNVCKHGIIEVADLADFLPMLEPVAKDINELVDG